MFLKKQRQRRNKRHRCSICKRVKYEKFMEKMFYDNNENRPIITRYGNQCWVCKNDKKCQQGAKTFRGY